MATYREKKLAEMSPAQYSNYLNQRVRWDNKIAKERAARKKKRA
jgi:hypothetical protein